ncbi:MAG: nuclear transport factor 2 family protein [Actinobacteria bacterium]|nr:MAG: nuclear transport factor 2 family protein [Actinomycetota bacterium]
MSESPIVQLLGAIDKRDVEAAMALVAPDCRLLVVDGRRVKGAAAVRELLTDFVATLRSTTHRVTAQWHQDDVWIAEMEATYELKDWLKIDALPARTASSSCTHTARTSAPSPSTTPARRECCLEDVGYHLCEERLA